jgi:hypothetical protein
MEHQLSSEGEVYSGPRREKVRDKLTNPLLNPWVPGGYRYGVKEIRERDRLVKGRNIHVFSEMGRDSPPAPPKFGHQHGNCQLS